MPSVAQPRTSVNVSLVSNGDLMLLESAAERVDRARDGMESGSSREKHRLLATAVQIVGELRSSLDVCGGDPLAANMGDLCDYICRQLVAANLQNRVATLDEVSHLLREARIAWVMLPPDARAAHAVAARE
jgi:flagellar protein FliS